MPRDWKGNYSRRLQNAASERGKRMAKARWAKFHAERDALAVKDPIQVGGKIVERLIRVIDERKVIERTFYKHDRPCDWVRKRKELLRT